MSLIPAPMYTARPKSPWRWRKEQLTVNERYDRKRQYTRHLAVRRDDGALVLTQQITRQGVPALIMHSIYRRRSTETALESGR